MSIDLADLVDNLKREVNPPGSDLFPSANDADFEGYLTDSFWEMMLRGYIASDEFTADDTVVTPVDGSTDADDQLGREYQQLIIINAAMVILRNHALNLDTGFRAHAGAAEFETRKSAQAIQAVLTDLRERFENILTYLPTDVETNPVYYTDANYARGYIAGSYDDPWFLGY